jgi:hypothetical protein
MKKVMLGLSVALCLVCAIIGCSKENETKIPACIKERINNQICRVDEYCSVDDSLSLYVFFDEVTLPYITLGYDENCNFFFIEQEGSPWHALEPGAFVLPDGTIEYREDIYHFKRTVYLNKN